MSSQNNNNNQQPSSSGLAPRPSPGVDTQDNRAFVQRSKLWVLGEMMATNLINTKPSDPIVATLSLLEEKREEAEAMGGASNHVSNPAAFQVENQPPSAEAVADAKLYMHEWRLAFLFEDWIKAVIEHRPSIEATLDFTIEFFKKVRDGQHAKWKRLRELQDANHQHQNNNQQHQQNSNNNNSAAAGTILIIYDSNAVPSPLWTTFAARAASVGVVEMGYTAVLKSLTEVGVQDLVESQGMLLVLGEEQEIEQQNEQQQDEQKQTEEEQKTTTNDAEKKEDEKEKQDKQDDANKNEEDGLSEEEKQKKKEREEEQKEKEEKAKKAAAIRSIDDSLIAKYSIVTQEQHSSGAIIICGQELSDERIEKLSTELFKKVCSVEKCAAVSNGTAVALGNSRALLMMERDEGSASACNLVGRKLVDDLMNQQNSSSYGRRF